MNHRTMKHGLALLATMGMAAGAQALPLSFEYGLPIVESTTEINETGALGLFDSNLGTLTGAVLDIFGSATTDLAATNNAVTPTRANITSSSSIFWSSGLAPVGAFLVDSIDLSMTTGFTAYTAGQTINFGSLTDNGTFSYNLGSILANLQAAGGGTFNVSCESLSGLNIQGGGGNLVTSQNTTAGCGARISYTYDARVDPPVPEPASLGLVGLGLLVGGAASVRRKS
jgi:PEP-CTERM motif